MREGNPHWGSLHNSTAKLQNKNEICKYFVIFFEKKFIFYEFMH